MTAFYVTNSSFFMLSAGLNLRCCHAIFIRGVSRPKDQSITFWGDPDYDSDHVSELRSLISAEACSL